MDEGEEDEEVDEVVVVVLVVVTEGAAGTIAVGVEMEETRAS